MENSFQTSFIPKKPIIENGLTSTKKSNINITMTVSLAILIVVCVAAGGLFFYKSKLQKDMDEVSSSLSKMKASFDDDTIVLLELYDKRSSAAQEIINNHLVVSPLFQALSDYTLLSIQYTKFSYSILNNTYNIKMSGMASDYKSIAQQADVFSNKKPGMFRDLIFSNLTKDKNNYVTFDVEFSIDSKLLSYEDNVSSMIKKDENIPSLPDDSTLPLTSETQ